MMESVTFESIKANYNVIEFVEGQRDCKQGKPHETGKSESYDAGYSCQYELGEIRSAQHEQNG